MITVRADSPGSVSGTLEFAGKTYPCVLGRGGMVAESAKREGDGATPTGDYKLTRGFYRADRVDQANAGDIELVPINDGMGWGDDPTAADYNALISSGYPAGGEEALMREDHLYDIVFVLDHNGAWAYEGERPTDIQVKPGVGSAIFLHVWRGEGQPTAGCIALAKDDLLEIASKFATDQAISIV